MIPVKPRHCTFFLVGLVVWGCSEKKVSVIDYGAITTIRYGDHVQPLLERSCAGCHGGRHPRRDCVWTAAIT